MTLKDILYTAHVGRYSVRVCDEYAHTTTDKRNIYYFVVGRWRNLYYNLLYYYIRHFFFLTIVIHIFVQIFCGVNFSLTL